MGVLVIGRLNDNQLVLLDNLIYLPGFAEAGTPEMRKKMGIKAGKDVTVGDYCEYLSKSGNLKKELGAVGGKVGDMDADECRKIISAIINDNDLLKLKVVKGENVSVHDVKVKLCEIDSYENNLIHSEKRPTFALFHPKTEGKFADYSVAELENEVKKHPNDKDLQEMWDKLGFRAVALEAPDGGKTVIFRGTSEGEWADNLVAFGTEDGSVKQKYALKFVDGVDGEDITVSGHSKGGNKAQYAAIMSDKVGYCLSYDGQGFGADFIEAHQSEIDASLANIHCIAANHEFVGSLGVQLKETEYYKTGHENVVAGGLDAAGFDAVGALWAHKPNAILDDKGKLNKKSDPSDFVNFMDPFSDWLIEKAKTDPEVEQRCLAALNAFEGELDEEGLIQGMGDLYINDMPAYVNSLAETYKSNQTIQTLNNKINEEVDKINEKLGKLAAAYSSMPNFLCKVALLTPDMTAIEGYLNKIMKEVEKENNSKNIIENIDAKPLVEAQIWPASNKEDLYQTQAQVASYAEKPIPQSYKSDKGQLEHGA